MEQPLGSGWVAAVDDDAAYVNMSTTPREPLRKFFSGVAIGQIEIEPQPLDKATRGEEAVEKALCVSAVAEVDRTFHGAFVVENDVWHYLRHSEACNVIGASSFIASPGA